MKPDAGTSITALAPALRYHDDMKHWIKICGITNRDDARAAVTAGANALGFNFFSKSRRFVEPSVARAIAAELPRDVLKVGVFVNHDSQQITDIVELVGLDAVQLHGDESPRLITELPPHVRVVRAHRCGGDGLSQLVEHLTASHDLGRLPDAVLIDADAGAEFGGSGKLADWALIREQRYRLFGLPLILAGGLRPENVADAIAAVEPAGVDVASGVEIEPGRKDHAMINGFVQHARAAFDRR